MTPSQQTPHYKLLLCWLNPNGGNILIRYNEKILIRHITDINGLQRQRIYLLDETGRSGGLTPALMDMYTWQPIDKTYLQPYRNYASLMSVDGQYIIQALAANGYVRGYRLIENGTGRILDFIAQP